MNVDAAMKSLRVLCFKSAQPNDPRGYRVPARSIRLENFACPLPIVEDRAGWGIAANLLRNYEITEGRRHSPSQIAHAILGC